MTTVSSFWVEYAVLASAVGELERVDPVAAEVIGGEIMAALHDPTPRTDAAHRAFLRAQRTRAEQARLARLNVPNPERRTPAGQPMTEARRWHLRGFSPTGEAVNRDLALQDPTKRPSAMAPEHRYELWSKTPGLAQHVRQHNGRWVLRESHR